MSDMDGDFMRRAMALAKQGGRTANCSPIGCVIVLDGRIIGESFNEVDKLFDPTAHAEILAMRRAGQLLERSRFKKAALYSTLQPCGMCSMACIWAGITRIIYGAGRHQVHKMYFEDRDYDTVDFVRNAYKRDLVIEGGVLGDLCAGLYYGPHDHPPASAQTNL